MDKEYVDTGYTGSIPINSEIRNVKNVFLAVGGVKLTFEQVKLLTVGAVAAFVGFYIANATGIRALIPFLVIIFAGPFVALAFGSIYGLPIDDYLMIWYAGNILASPVRKNNTLNDFESLELAADTSRQKDKKKKKQKVIRKKIVSSHVMFK